MKDSKREPAFVYHHIPKCGGTSFLASLYRWFAVIPDYEDEFASFDAFLTCPVRLKSLHAGTLLTGHWNQRGSAIGCRYPDLLSNERFLLFSVVREPYDLVKSLFYYTRKMRPDLVKSDLDLQSLKRFLIRSRNYLAGQFGCNEENYRQILDRYFFIGTTENLDETIRDFVVAATEALSHFPDSRMAVRTVLRLKSIQPACGTRINTAERDCQEASLTAADEAAFKERNELDYRIYDTICARQRKLLEGAG